jgi:hypothetical protein
MGSVLKKRMRGTRTRASAKHPCDYKYSSAGYYELNDKSFNFLKDLWEVF